MGTFRHPIEIGDAAGNCFQKVEALVDSGSSYTWIPSSILKGLGISPGFKREFIMADGRVIEREMEVVQARLNGQTLPTLVIFGDEGTEPLLGAHALEGFGFAPDPINHRLIPVRGYLLLSEKVIFNLKFGIYLENSC